MTEDSDGTEFDVDWWATADLEGIREVDIPTYINQLGAESELSGVPKEDMLARAHLNMRKYAGRTKRADAKAQAELNHAVARKWLAVSIPLAGVLSTLLWLARAWA